MSDTKLSDNPIIVAMVNELTQHRDYFSQRCLALSSALAQRDATIQQLSQLVAEARAGDEAIIKKATDLEYEVERLTKENDELRTAASAELLYDPPGTAVDPIQDEPVEVQPFDDAPVGGDPFQYESPRSTKPKPKR